MADQAGIRPPGALVRQSADWFSDYLYVASYQTDPAPIGGDNAWITVSIFNQDPLGRVAKVYGITAMDDGGGGFGFYYLNGKQGALVGLAPNVRPDYPVSQVQVYQQFSQISDTLPNPYFTTNPVFTVSTSGFDGNMIVSPFPLAIVPVGWSLIGTNITGGGANALTYWFQMASK